jgi:dihydroflavonol-4-reductase
MSGEGKILVTGADSFLGYHVVKRLNQRGQRPRVLVPVTEPSPSLGSLELRKLDIELAHGKFDDPASLRAACQGVRALLHLSFHLSLSAGAAVEKALHTGNVLATRNLLDAAALERVERVVVSSSSLSIGLAREPRCIDESAPWETCGLTLPYAVSRRQAEQEALARPSGAEHPVVVAVNPTFTAGPDDFSRAPANALLGRMASGLRIDAPIGFSLLDVRDFADGVLAALERGQHGQRYLLSGGDTTPRALLGAVCRVRGVRPPRLLVPLRAGALRPLLALQALRSTLAGEAPPVTPAVLEIWGRYAWYDTRRARAELGWQPRLLDATLLDTLAWLDSRKKLQAERRPAAVPSSEHAP